ncbi:PAS domain-containing protein [Marinibaculum pumilum]|uniref:histidine kinase n=1 Tax=Marinibaculum pumilum TaxID=1766165 RepID=A0ABV7L6E5_9PROT
MTSVEQAPDEASMQSAIRHSPLPMIVTDPRLADNPITYVNRAFETLTLYSRAFALGRNCRFLQGPGTDPGDIERIREGLRSGRAFQVTLTNHRADGSPFRNQLLIAPVHSAEGDLTAYFGVQRLADEKEDGGDPASGEGELALLRELQHRVKNHLAMVVSMIRVQARREVTPDSLKAISRRIEALALLYDELIGAGDSGTKDIAAGAYLSRIASVISSIETRPAIRVNVECDDITLSLDHAARLGLLLSEFLTNALQHAFKGRDAGYVEVRFYRVSGGGIRLSVEDDGIGLPGGSDWPAGSPSIETQRDRAENDAGALDTGGHGGEAGVGGSIVAALSGSLGATLNVASAGRGTIITVDFSPEG